MPSPDLLEISLDLFRVLFENAPSLYLVLEPEEFRIIAVSEAYLAATMTRRDDIIGKKVFEVFPDDPGDPFADGVRNLRASLERVKSDRRADAMAVQRYPIRRPESEGGQFEMRWWSSINSPIFDDRGKLTYIVHRVEDVTRLVQGTEEGEKTDKKMLESHLQRMQTEILLRGQDLQAGVVVDDIGSIDLATVELAGHRGLGQAGAD